MKKCILCAVSALLIVIFSVCAGSLPVTQPPESDSSESRPPKAEAAETSANELKAEVTQMQIIVKSSEYEIVYELNDSRAAKELYNSLPLTVEVEPFSDNEITFYPPEKLNSDNAPLSGGEAGSLSYYAPWGDVVMFYAPCDPNGSLYELGRAVSGADSVGSLSGTVTVSAN